MERELIGWSVLTALVVLDIVASYVVMRSDSRPLSKILLIIATWLIPIVGPILLVAERSRKRGAVDRNATCVSPSHGPSR